MALILKNNILFLHVPKTGGNWVEKVLAQQNLIQARISHKHATYDLVCQQPLSLKVKKMIRQTMARNSYLTKNPRIFCVVRHPITWYESWFKFQTSLDWRTWGTVGAMDDWHVLSDMNLNADRDFNRFMENVNTNSPGFVSQLYSQYTRNSGAIVLKTETLAQNLADFLESSGVACDRHAILKAERVNESPKLDFEWDCSILEETLKNERAGLKKYEYQAPGDQADVQQMPSVFSAGG